MSRKDEPAYGGEQPQITINTCSSDGSVEIVVVLGYELTSGPNGAELADEAKNRVKTGLEVFDDTDTQYLVFTGGKGNPSIEIPESVLMKKYALEHGAREADILLETDSVNTRQNGRYVKWLVDQCFDRPVGKIHLVTSDYHMSRATKIFESCFNQGIEVQQHEFKMSEASEQ
jgi:uncharacterized SAM-binding protein YcdF (DUF218 family)